MGPLASHTYTAQSLEDLGAHASASLWIVSRATSSWRVPIHSMAMLSRMELAEFARVVAAAVSHKLWKHWGV